MPGFLAERISLDVYYEGDGTYAGKISALTLAVGTHNQRIIQELYRSHLGRNADAAGLREWTARLESGIPLEQVVREIRTSTEASQLVVVNAFQGLLGRSPQLAGLESWTTFLQSGHDMADLRAELMASREYQSTHSRRETINSIYQTFLGRDAGQAGIETWLKNWEAGMTLNQIIPRSKPARNPGNTSSIPFTRKSSTDESMDWD